MHITIFDRLVFVLKAFKAFLFIFLLFFFTNGNTNSIKQEFLDIV